MPALPKETLDSVDECDFDGTMPSPAETVRAFSLPQGDPRLWLSERLQPLTAASPTAAAGDGDLNRDWRPATVFRDAAVLIPIVERSAGLTVLLTLRSSHLSSHAGQIAFPGGRIEPDDDSIVSAALRETEEETGIAPAFVTPVGRLGPYETGSAFRIHPVVGVVHEGFSVIANPAEVDDIFEVPLDFLLNAANRQVRSGTWQGQIRQFYAIPYGDYNIWGATAGILVSLGDRLAAP